MKKLLFVLCCALIFVACEETTPTTTPPSTDTTGIKLRTNQSPKADLSTSTANLKELEKVGQTISFTSFNADIQKAVTSKAEWTTSPLFVALKFAGTGMNSPVKSVRAESMSGGENFDKLIVTIEEDGLLDDSIAGNMTILRMELTQGVWQISKATMVWKCWQGRGHENYGGTPCN